MKDLKNVNKPTKRILIGALILFMVSAIFFLYLLMTQTVESDAVWVMFFVYGALYSGLFWVCVQLAYKLKNLKIGIIVFLSVLILGF